MPSVSIPDSKPVAILCSDLHLTLTKPSCRSDASWKEVQARYLGQIKDLARSYGKVPIICAGDIFDRWNASPELINFALKHLPDNMLCVAGQHDLPNHNLGEIERSGFGVLVQAKKIYHLDNSPYIDPMLGLAIYGASWKSPIPIPLDKHRLSLTVGKLLHIVVIHRYLWVEGRGYPGAPLDHTLPAIKKTLSDYDVAVFGDNHRGFLARKKDRTGKCCIVFNCGGFIRRRSDEIDYKPQVGILFRNGSVKSHYLDTSQDSFNLEIVNYGEEERDIRAFLEQLEQLGDQALNFRESIDRLIHDKEIPPPVVDLILASIRQNKS